MGYLGYGLGVGVAVACGYVPMVAVVGAWFDRRRALAIGIAVAGIGVGTLAGPPLAAALIATSGWRQAHVLLGLGGALLLVAAAVVVHRPPEPVGGEPLVLRDVVRTAEFRVVYLATLLASVAQLFGVRGLGALVGLVYTAAGVGALVGPPLAGVVVDATGGFGWAVAGAGLFGAAAFLALLALPAGDRPGPR